MLLKQSTARTLLIFMTSSSDHIAGKTGLSAGLTIYLSKDGGAPASITPTVAELDATNMPGWYSLALTTTHTNTLGDWALHATGSGADPTDLVRQVVADLPGASVSSVTGAVGSVTGAVGSVTGLTASDVAAIKTNTDKLGDVFEADSSPANYRFTAHALAQAPTGGSAPTAAAVATAVRTELTAELASIPRIETVTDKLGDMTEADSSPANHRFTVHALANAPSGGTAPTAIAIADEVQTRTIAAVTTVGAVTGNVGGNVVGSVGSLVGYTAPLSAAGTRTAVGLATANLDTQLSAAAGTRLLEGAFTHDDLIRLISAIQLGKTTIAQGSPSGAVVTYRDVNDTTDRAVYEVSSNPAERLSSTLTP